MVIELGRGTLTCEQIGLIARRHEPVRLAAGIDVKLAAGHAAVLALAAGGPVYGRSTGVGALIHQRFDQPLGHAAATPHPLAAPTRSTNQALPTRCCTVTPPRPAPRCRQTRSER